MDAYLITKSKAYVKRLILPILFICFLFCACSSDDDTTLNSTQVTISASNGAPQWKMDWSFNQARPDWKEPEGSNFENWTVIMVKIEEELEPYTSEDDMMAVFIDGEVRGLAGPAIYVDTGEKETTYFLMNVWGNETNDEWVNVTLKYYNSRLKHVFSRTASVKYDEDRMFGIDEDFIPNFTYGPSKYPIVMIVSLDSTPIAEADIDHSGKGKDIIGAFVGDECRGISMSNSRIIIYGREEGESVTLKYYESVNQRLLTFPDALKTEKQEPLNAIYP